MKNNFILIKKCESKGFLWREINTKSKKPNKNYTKSPHLPQEMRQGSKELGYPFQKVHKVSYGGLYYFAFQWLENFPLEW